MVTLDVVPHLRRRRVLVGTSVRKPANILAAYLTALEWQRVPLDVDVTYCFAADGLDQDALDTLQHFLARHRGYLLPVPPVPAGDYSDQGVTHSWTDSAMRRVGQIKDAILDIARRDAYDAVWLCDADLICDPTTLASLLSVPEPIVAACYWTRWHRGTPEQAIHAAPQVWQTHPYDLNGNGMDEGELRTRLLAREIVPVRGQGACTLIRREALERGVCFAPLPDNTGPGLMQGEDRHFCLRAERLHLRMVADAWPDIFHIYHRPDDEERIGYWLARLGAQRPTHAALGHLVSLTLEPLEPFVQGNGLAKTPPVQARGRLGALPLHPALADAVVGMRVGDTKLVPVPFGRDWPFAPYRGTTRLIRVTLHDVKAYGAAPVVEEELMVSTQTGAWVDGVGLTAAQHAQLREETHGPDELRVLVGAAGDAGDHPAGADDAGRDAAGGGDDGAAAGPAGRGGDAADAHVAA